MPSLLMEYTAPVAEQVAITELLEHLHDGMLNCGLFKPSAVRSKALCIEQWLLGEDKSRTDFIYITVEMLDGRTVEQKKALSQLLLQIVETQASCISNLAVNIRDMDRATFQKAEFH